MKWFKKMIEVASTKGIRYADAKDGDYDHLIPIDTTGFLECVEKCQVFVFSPKYEEPQRIQYDEKVLYPEIDPPFEVMSIEMLGDNRISVIDTKSAYETGMFECDIYCIMNWEIIGEDGIYYGQYFLIKTYDWFVFSTAALRPMVKDFLDRIGSEKDGIERVRSKIKIGRGKNKRFHTIRRIIHIKQKVSSKIEIQNGREIDFSHRFVRRGHWRNLGDGKVGKNRSGDYCIPSKTWVNESKPIGPEDKPIIKKVRFVNDED